MATVTIHAGDFHKGSGELNSSYFILKSDKRPDLGEMVFLKDLDVVEIATEESVKKIGGTVGWGVAGAILLGPVGLLAGLLLGGRKKEVTFVARFKDGRKILATTDSRAFTELQAATFR
jgi:hypothetical protein